jgi:cytochrome c oxidase cbb3-type subunit 2
MYNPRDVVPESNMPAFPWLFEKELSGEKTGAKMSALRTVGVPYTDEDISGAKAAVEGRKEIDALVAYLQQLGTLLQTRR